MRTIPYAVYLNRYRKYPLIDVRSPKEYRRGHLPGAVNIPLFSDQNRALVGTLYKQAGSQAAIKQALGLINLPQLAQKAEKLKAQTLAVYCFRGGLRSASVGWLFELLGYQVLLLKKGYKGGRSWVLKQFEKKYPLAILSGETGVGKTRFLKQLEHIDLEGLACHRGSVFGAFQKPQPTQENFENQLAFRLFCFEKKSRSKKPGSRRIWLEDESRLIGNLILPKTLFEQMQKAPSLILEDSLENRLQRILNSYRRTPKEKLRAAILRIQKRLGGEIARQALELLEQQKLKECSALLLGYYDKKYAFTIEKRKSRALKLDLQNPSGKAASQALAAWLKNSSFFQSLD
ncbi:MAG: tRNA 2-selenouridine(34) synthase MnmH [Parachlamydiales bacterium]|jgi:tRNA 2-selenouridine synthase